jgi:LysM repeat protein
MVGLTVATAAVLGVIAHMKGQPQLANLPHFVDEQDTLADIAAMYGAEVDDIRAANDLDPNATLQAGSRIDVPVDLHTDESLMSRLKRVGRRLWPRRFIAHWTSRRTTTAFEHALEVDDVTWEITLRRQTSMSGRTDRLIIRRNGDVVWDEDFEGILVTFDNLDAESRPQPGADVTGSGVPCLVFDTYSLGAHCCFTLHILTLAEGVDEILRLPTEDAAAEFSDVDDQAGQEIVVYDWTFAYWNASFAGSPAPRVILAFADGEYTVAPTLMRRPAPTAAEQAAAVKEILKSEDYSEWYAAMCSRAEEVDRADSQALAIPIPPVAFWAAMLDLIYSGNAPHAERLLAEVWPESLPGRAAFYSEFREQLRLSQFYHGIARLNDWPTTDAE